MADVGTHVTPEFADLMANLAEAWGGRITAERIKQYAAHLDGISMAQLQAACSRAVRECKFFPSVAELRAMCGPSADDAGMLAWTALNRAAADVGGYATLTIEDGHAAEALRMVFGTWGAFCGQAGADGGWGQKRQEFLVAYREAQRMAPAGFARLPGLCEEQGPLGVGASVPLLTARGQVQAAAPPARLGDGGGHGTSVAGETGGAPEGPGSAPSGRGQGGQDGPGTGGQS